MQHRDKLVTNNVTPFIGYCRSQAQKYSLKGVRLQELERVVNFLEKQNIQLSLLQVVDQIELSEYVKREEYIQPNGYIDKYLTVLGIKLQLNKYIKEILPPLRSRLSEYGARTKKTVNEGKDWKAYSHAFRVMWELEELLTEGKITFPNKGADYLVKIKTGEVDFEDMQDRMYSEMDRVLGLPNNLPKRDRKFWDDWILTKYM